MKTILIVEDVEFNFFYLQELIYDYNSQIEIIHAENGEEAIEICKNNKAIDLVFMDIKMPVMTGDVAAKIIKEENPLLPIIAQSAYALKHERKKYDSFFDDYIVKPIFEHILLEILQKYEAEKF